MSTSIPTVFVVDDDPQVCESLGLMVRSAEMNVQTFASAEAFLDAFHDSDDSPKCIVLDARMPGLSGLGLQQLLVSDGKNIPIIMISGCADIPMAVKAMMAGAVDFLEKPINRRTLLTRIQEAIDQHVNRQRKDARKSELAACVEKLSTRQREVLDLLLAGGRSKQIAKELGIGEKTVAKHRAAVLERMQVDSVVELVHLFSESNVPHCVAHTPAA
jgi:two-component system, LuxR family, response regulator FixJ